MALAALEQSRRAPAQAVPGAKLRVALARLASEQGIDLTVHLVSRQLSFARFLEEQTDLLLMRRAGTDMLVGTSVDEFSTPAPGQSQAALGSFIRQDLFEALTFFMGGGVYFYDPGTDRAVRFGPEDSRKEDGLIPLPPATVEQEMADRRNFVTEHDAPELLESLAEQRWALTRFSNKVKELGLQSEWHRVRYEILRRRLLDWATKAHVEVRSAWFEREGAAHEGRADARALLWSLMDYMTDEELLATRIPLSAVYNLLAKNRKS